MRHGHPFYAPSRHACCLSCARIQPTSKIQELCARQIPNFGASGGRGSHSVSTVGDCTRYTKPTQSDRTLAPCFTACTGAIGLSGGRHLVLIGTQQRGGGQVAPNLAGFVRASAHKRLERQHHTGEGEVEQLKKKPAGLTRRGLLGGAACRIRTDDLPLTRRVLYQLS